MIPSLNSEDTIGCALSSILANVFPRDEYEIIVVDGGSTDNTVGICRTFAVKVFFCLKRGWAAALNLGIEKARGEIICITNTDVIVPADWLKKIWEFFRNHPDVEGVGGPHFPPRISSNIIQRFSGEIFVEDQGFPVKLTRSKFMKMWDGGLVCGPACAYKRETLLSAGGLKESLMSYSDIDLCWRLVKMGKLLMFVPEIEVIHLGFPSTLKGVFSQQFKWGRGYGELMKLYYSGGVVDRLKREAHPFRQILKASLLLLSPTSLPKTKQFLRWINYVSFNLGRIRGLG